MSLTLQCIIAFYAGCWIVEACDGFRSTRRLAREVVRQWTWVGRRVRRLIP